MKRIRAPRGPLPIARPKVGVSEQPELIVAGGDRLLELRAKLGLSREIFARLMNVSPRTIQAVERDQGLARKIQRPYAEIAHLVMCLMCAFPRRDIGLWLLRPLYGRRRSTPLEMIERGEVFELWELVFRKLYLEPIERRLEECHEQISRQNCQVGEMGGQS